MTTTTHGASAELLPCPFCGGEAQTDFIEGESYLIECYACRAETGIKDSPEEAVECWNRRAAQPAAPVVPKGWRNTLEHAANKLVTLSQLMARNEDTIRLIGELRAISESLAAPPPAAPQAEQVAKAGPRTLMGEEQAEKWAWEQVKKDVGTKGWTAGDSCNYFGFFLWGWRYRKQYERQRATPERAAAPTDLTNAARDVLAERRRQVDAEHRTLEEDDAMTSGQMATVAGYYALASGHPHERDLGRGTVPSYWPWTAEWWKPRDKRRNLVRAGALILAEVERLDRAAHQASAPTGDSAGRVRASE